VNDSDVAKAKRLDQGLHDFVMGIGRWVSVAAGVGTSVNAVGL
jgi:hypothetical protein